MNKGRTIWIVDRKTDLRWFFFIPFCASLVLLSCYAWLSQSVWSHSAVITTYLVSAILLDSPHSLGTYSRAFSGYQAKSPESAFLWGSFGVWLVAPALFIPCMLWGSLDHIRALSSGWSWVWIIFSQYHFLRQNWGLTQLYCVKQNGSFHQKQLLKYLQASLLIMGAAWSIIPYLGKTVFVYSDYFSVSSDVWRNVAFSFLTMSLLALVSTIHWLKHRFGKYLMGSLLLIAVASFFVGCGMLSYSYFNVEVILEYAQNVVCLGFWISAILLGILSFLMHRQGHSLLPILYLVSIVCFQKIIFSLKLPYVIAYACISVPHCIHYIFMVHVYNRRFYEKKPSIKSLGNWLNQRPILWFLTFTVLGSLLVLVRHIANNTAHNMEIFHYGAVMFLSLSGWHHNLLDAVIWRKEFIAATLEPNTSFGILETNTKVQAA